MLQGPVAVVAQKRPVRNECETERQRVIKLEAAHSSSKSKGLLFKQILILSKKKTAVSEQG
jgi:hypothetical protein